MSLAMDISWYYLIAVVVPVGQWSVDRLCGGGQLGRVAGRYTCL